MSKIKFSRLHTALYIALGITLPLTSYAADSSTPSASSVISSLLPPSTNAGRVGEQLAPPPTNEQVTQVTVPGFKPGGVSASAYRTQFVLKELDVTGASVYGNQQIENMFRNYIGRTVSLADLQQMADTITLKYRNDGYVLTQAVVPAQNISSGVVTIRVVEGFVNHVDIQGDPKGARNLLQGYADKIMQARPLNIKQLERYVLLANDIPGMNVRAVLSPAAQSQDVLAPTDAVPGAANLTFVVQQHTAGGYFSFDNRGTRYLGPNEFNLGGNINSIFVSGDQTGVQGLLTSDLKELQYIRLYNSTPLNNEGLLLNLGASYSHSEPGFTLTPLDVVGTSKSASAGVSYPAIRSRVQSLYLNLGVDASNSTDNILGTQLYDDRLRSVRAGVNYNINDSWLGSNQIGGQVSQGLKAFGASPDNGMDVSRPFGQSDYTKFNMDLGRLQSLSHNFSLLVAGQGQYTPDSLLAEEQFGYGGINYGQAYDPSEIVGDRGAEGKAELRLDTQPNFKILRNIQYFTFYDIGKVWNVHSITGVPSSASGASAGVGLRTNFTSFLTGTLEWAKPLTRDVATAGNENARIFFSIGIAGDTPASYTAAPLPVVQPIQTGNGLTPVYPASLPANPPNVPPIAKATTTTAPARPVATVANTTATKPAGPQYQGLTEVNSNVSPVPAKTSTNAATGNYYTLQLMGSRNISDLQHFIAQHQLSNAANIVHTQHNGSNWYILTYGHYATSHAALSARNDLPATVLQQNPWVKHIEG